MIFIIEAVLACLLFTIIVTKSVNDNPLNWISDYPPRIVERCKELGLIKEVETIKTPKVLARKLIAAVCFGVLMGVAITYINGAKSFNEGFLISYGLWLVVAWYDAFVIDCIWFAHSKKIIIPGTEDMIDEYHNYWFHIKMSFIGSLIGLPVAIFAGLIVTLLV